LEKAVDYSWNTNSHRYTLQGKVLHVPRYLELLGEKIIHDELRSRYASENLINVLGKSQFVTAGLLCKNSKFVAVASLCGMKSNELV